MEKNGKKEALAKGIKKIVSKQSGHLEPFTLVDVEIINGKELDHVTKVSVVNIFKNIRSNLEKSLLVSRLIKLIDKIMVAGEVDKRVFILIQDWLEYIDRAVKINEYLLYSFILKLLGYLGFSPELNICVNCGLTQKKSIGFDIENGGLCCEDCKKGAINDKFIFPLTTGEINCFRVLLNGTWPELTELEKYERVLKLAEKFARYHSGQKF